jgi:outer membrane protein assembly factor BamB
MHHPLHLVGIALLLVSQASALTDSDAAAQAKSILAQSGVKGGFAVHVGSGDGTLTAALRANDSYQVHGLDPDAKKVAAAREAILKKGSYGPVSVDVWNGKDLPYVEGSVNLLLIDDGQVVAPSEIERVLAPLGVAMTNHHGAWQKTEKAWPREMDEWTHYYYNAAGNAASHDTTVGPPERLQWLGSPRWSRHHDRMSSLSAMVSSHGRLFYIMDEGSRISILLPSKFQLIARDAFNGVILWKKPIPQWSTNMWPLKTGPTQLTRRLVADGDRIFVTMGITSPVSCVDAATGEIIRTFEETKGAEEMIFAGGTVFVLVNPSAEYVLKDYAPKQQNDQGRVAQEYEWDRKPRVLMAINPDTGKLLWKKEGLVAPITTSCDGKRLAYYDGDKIVCLDPATGAAKWTSVPEPKRKVYEFNFGPRLLIHDDMILYAGGDGTMKGLDANSGQEKWVAPHEKSGYRSPEDLIVTKGLVWNAPDMQGSMSGKFTGRDPVTGAVKKEFAPDIDAFWFHHRCYIAKATDNYIIPSRTGIEYVDPDKSHWEINHWVRGACLYGVLPANGLTMAGPHDCACYPEAKLFGMNALAPKAKHPLPAPIAEEARLEKGPAYDAVKDEAADGNDWPTYRHDPQRSSYTNQPLAKDLSANWEVKLGGKLSALTVAGGKAYVSQIDAHTLYAFDAVTGKEAWHFIAGSRVDSPPTYWNGRVIFGCMDGNVYCLRASDGAMVWRFRAAPTDLRHFAFEALESVWPVHGGVLLENGVVSLVSGRSCFLDGGMRFLRLDAKSGRKLVEVAYDHNDPDTGKDLQMLHKNVQMPTALNDILSSNGKGTIYLRSQKIEEKTGKRYDLAPVSGNATEQAAAQHGGDSHIFAAFGYLDQEWFHRSLWIYGEHSAGGAGGYYQPGKFAPTGRILVFDDKNVYSYGREAKYFKWTTTMEHTLFSTSKEAPEVGPAKGGGGGGGKKKGKKAQAAAKQESAERGVKFPETDALSPGNDAFTVEAWVLPDDGTGVIISHGGPSQGYALALKDRKPQFLVRSAKELATAASAEALGEGWHHLAGVLAKDKSMTLYVDGQKAGAATATGLVAHPKMPLMFGGSFAVADGKMEGYTGMLDQVVIQMRALSAEEIAQRVAQPEARPTDAALICTFDNGDARDDSGHGHNGVATGVDSGKGKVGGALWFRKPDPHNEPLGKKDGGSYVQHGWDTFVPIVTRAMTLAGRTLFVGGPPDTLDEEYAFERMAAKDPAIQHELEEQDAALDGKRGAKLWAMNVDTGEQGNTLELDSPPVWDGMVVARGKLYVATVDGRVKCFGK